MATHAVQALKDLKTEHRRVRDLITAKCFECMCHYDDGQVSCEIESCPLFEFMPYNRLKSKKQ